MAEVGGSHPADALIAYGSVRQASYARKNRQLTHKTMKNYLLAVLLLIPVTGFSQLNELDEILRSGNYHWGEGYAETREESVRSARVDLIEKLVVVIDSEVRSEVEETDEIFRSEFASRTRSLSRMQLRGLNYKNLERRDGTWRTIAYISKEDYQNTLDIERNKLTSLLNQAVQSERISGLLQAVPMYAELWVERQFYPIPFYTSAEAHGEETELESFMRSRFREWMDNIQVKVLNVEVYGDSDLHETNIALELTYNGMPVNHLMVGYDRSGYGLMEVVDGVVNVFIDLLPDAPEVTYRLVFQPKYRGSDTELQVIAELTLPQVRRRITANVLSQIDLDFSVTRIGTGGYQFNPDIRNLAVSELRWDFGDGRSSTQSAPRHVFADTDKSHIVTLTANRNNQLVTRRELLPDGRLRPWTDERTRREPAFTEAGTRPGIPADREVTTRGATRDAEERESATREGTGISPRDPAPRSPETPAEVADAAARMATPEKGTVAESAAGRSDAAARDATAPDRVTTPAASESGFFEVPSGHRDIVEELKRSRSYSEAVGKLTHYQNQNRLRFGDRRAVGNVTSSYVFVVNTEQRTVEAFLSPEVENVRKNLLSNEGVENLSERYRGRAPIWIEIF